eukprot:SAG22_NODE_1011_length_6041_cov_11.536856_2_plen_157_part_00
MCDFVYAPAGTTRVGPTTAAQRACRGGGGGGGGVQRRGPPAVLAAVADSAAWGTVRPGIANTANRQPRGSVCRAPLRAHGSARPKKTSDFGFFKILLIVDRVTHQFQLLFRWSVSRLMCSTHQCRGHSDQQEPGRRGPFQAGAAAPSGTSILPWNS